MASQRELDIKNAEKVDNPYKVRLSVATTITRPGQLRANSVVFDVAPELVENRNINYKSFDPLHAPGQIFVYSSTSSRTFQLSNIKLISRTPQEATENLARLWTLRSWTMPNFGIDPGSKPDEFQGEKISIEELIRQMSAGGRVNGYKEDANGNAVSKSYLGAPPPILRLSAYTGDGVGHIRNIPVVITQISIPYPTDVDYIPTTESGKLPTPMPTIMTLDIQLTETHSPSEYEQFDLQQYKIGRLPGFGL